MENLKPKLLVITGPTASGKTDAAIEIATRIGGEIVSADSMQLYRGMDIGTAKPAPGERGGIPHHMIDAFSPFERVTVSEYREGASAAIRDIESRGRRAIVCGGTGLYIDALTKPMRMGAPEDEEARAALKAAALEEGGKRRLYDMLWAVDPRAAEKFGENDVRRIVRAIENYRETGKTMDERAREDAARAPEFESAIFALRWPRETLYARIDARVDDMLARGLIGEVAGLLREGLAFDSTAMQAIGYKEIALALSGRASMEEARTQIQKASRNYAKRQMTWFRRDERVRWIDAPSRTRESIADEILTIYDKIGATPKREQGEI